MPGLNRDTQPHFIAVQFNPCTYHALHALRLCSDSSQIHPEMPRSFLLPDPLIRRHLLKLIIRLAATPGSKRKIIVFMHYALFRASKRSGVSLGGRGLAR